MTMKTPWQVDWNLKLFRRPTGGHFAESGPDKDGQPQDRLNEFCPVVPCLFGQYDERSTNSELLGSIKNTCSPFTVQTAQGCQRRGKCCMTAKRDCGWIWGAENMACTYARPIMRVDVYAECRSYQSDISSYLCWECSQNVERWVHHHAVALDQHLSFWTELWLGSLELHPPQEWVLPWAAHAARHLSRADPRC